MSHRVSRDSEPRSPTEREGRSRGKALGREDASSGWLLSLPGFVVAAAVAMAMLLAGGFMTSPGSASAQESDPDLSITKTDNMDPMLDPEQALIYFVTITNNGGDTTSQVVMVDRLPSQVEFLSTNFPGNCNYDSGDHEVVCSFSEIEAGDDIEVLIHVKGTGECTEITNVAGLSESGGDPSPPDRVRETTGMNCRPGQPEQEPVQEPLQTEGPDLRLDKRDSKDPVHPNEEFSYILSLANAGDEATTGTVQLVDELPRGVEFKSVDNPNCEYGSSDHAVVCDFVEIQAGRGGDIVIRVKAPHECGQIDNVVYLQGRGEGVGGDLDPPGRVIESTGVRGCEDPDRDGKITIKKEVVHGDRHHKFDFDTNMHTCDAGDGSHFRLSDDEHARCDRLDDGKYVVDEHVPDGWHVWIECKSDHRHADVRTDNSRGIVEIWLDDGEHVTCVFFNEKKEDLKKDDGKLTIIKEVKGGSHVDFKFWGDHIGHFTLDDDHDGHLSDRKTFEVKPGHHTIKEVEIPHDWKLILIECSDGQWSHGPEIRVHVDHDKHVTCVFFNEHKDPRIIDRDKDDKEKDKDVKPILKPVDHDPKPVEPEPKPRTDTQPITQPVAVSPPSAGDGGLLSQVSESWASTYGAIFSVGMAALASLAAVLIGLRLARQR